MIVVDASVWISRVVREDVHHGPSRRWLDQYLRQTRTVVAPIILLAEVAGGVARRTGRPRLARRVIDDLLDLPELHLVPLNGELAELSAQLAANLLLRGVDATYVATAQRLTLPLVSWDREQRERAGNLVETHTPETAPL